MSAKIYAFRSLCSLSAAIPPLNEVVKLWDVLLAYGVHMNIFFYLAHIFSKKEEILKGKNIFSLLKIEKLDARTLIDNSISLTRIIPENLYDRIARHPYCSLKYIQRVNIMKKSKRRSVSNTKRRQSIKKVEFRSRAKSVPKISK